MTRRNLALLATATAMMAASCGGAGDGATAPSTTSATTSTLLGAGNGSFTMRTETFVDDSRSTDENPGRSLPTDIYVPGGDGPFPLIMHAHGMSGTSAKFSELLSLWAQAGYIVVAPNFPRTNGDLPEDQQDLGDYVNQPDDVRFVLDQVLAQNESGGALQGQIATDHLAISGLSLGGATTYPLLFHPCCEDERYVSAILMSALELPFAGAEYDWTKEFPILAFAGTADEAIPYELQTSIIAKLPGPTWFVTLHDGMHAQPFENNVAPHDQLVVETTLDFWAMTLRGGAETGETAENLVATGTVDGLSNVEYRP